MAKRKVKKEEKLIIKVIILIFILLFSYYRNDIERFLVSKLVPSYALSDIPEYSKEKYVFINNNIPDFKEEDFKEESFEYYSNLDILGRCGVAFANIGIDLMPTKERESIGSVKPSGWQTSKYDFIDGKYLYNRCHLIGYQLTGENANPNNLITCTRSMNAKTMLEWENKVANYVKKTNNHVLYRVTPIFKSNNLLATGVQMEAQSVEDNGRGIKFNIFIYNVEDGVNINYLDGSNSKAS